MRCRCLIRVSLAFTFAVIIAGCAGKPARLAERHESPGIRFASRHPAATNPPVTLRDFYYETTNGRVALPSSIAWTMVQEEPGWQRLSARMPDGRRVDATARVEQASLVVQLAADPAEDIVRWGASVDAQAGEYFTGLMERVVDGPQQASWAPGITNAMDLRGQRVEMILKPTTSVYAPFYLSSRGYAVFVRGDWPGVFDFCAADARGVQIAFEGPSFEFKVYRANDPAALVKAHALEAGPPFLPPRWMFSPWRWRDEHRQRAEYYDGTPVTGPFNAEVMEDVLMMKAYGIPCGVYWVDRPWGPGRLGYDDFEIDPVRLPHFGEMVRWLNERQIQIVLWIGPFFQGQMATNALDKGYQLAGQRPQRNNYPLVDFTNPEAKAYWQEGVAKLLRLGVAGFKLDRSEEGIPERGPHRVFDGRSVRENRNAYPVMYLQATYDITKQFRTNNDFVLMPRAAYTGSSPYGVFWGGDIGGTPEGLRASIIAVQRAAVMGYPNWGSDTCGYNRQTLDQEMCARWLAFSCFTPIMEVGPTRNVGFWNLPREPKYDAELIAVWRLYARLHERLAEYGYAQAREAGRSGMPIVRPLFLVDPAAPPAWTNWSTYLYGPDLVVSPVWEPGRRAQEVYLPAGAEWRDVWRPERTYVGGRTVTVAAERHQIPLFIRVGADLPVGDLNREYQESLAVAAEKPDLAQADAEVKGWFEKRRPEPGP